MFQWFELKLVCGIIANDDTCFNKKNSTAKSVGIKKLKCQPRCDLIDYKYPMREWILSFA